MAFNVVTTLATYRRGTREAFIRQIGFLVPQGCPAPQTVEYVSRLSVSAAILVHFIHSCICLRRYNVQGPELLVFFWLRDDKCLYEIPTCLMLYFDKSVLTTDGLRFVSLIGSLSGEYPAATHLKHHRNFNIVSNLDLHLRL